MQQIIIDFGRFNIFGSELHLRIFGYGLMLVLGFICGILVARWRARRCGEDQEIVTQCGVLALAGGVVGARIFYVARHWADYAGSTNLIASLIDVSAGGLIYFGGLAGGAIIVIIYLQFKKLPARRFLDIIAPSLMLGLAFGRMGCTLNGCCWGGPANQDWLLGMKFPMISRPLLNFDGDSPYSPDQSTSPIYTDLYWQGLVTPDERLINTFVKQTRHLEDQNRDSTRNMLIPLSEYHGQLNCNQVDVLLLPADEAAKLFQISSGGDSTISRHQFEKSLADKTGILRGSESWSQAVAFDADGDGMLSFGEMQKYMQARLANLLQNFDADRNGHLSAAERQAADSWLRQNMYDILRTQWTPKRRPAQVLGIINALLLFGLLNLFFRYRKCEGQVFALMLILYPPTRFLLESVRDDDHFNLFHGNWTHNQISAWFIVAAGLVIWHLVKLRPSAGPCALKRKELLHNKPK
ncbi:MAG TPA: prolipoprotein diacylglyceryl transferase [Phycisphaerae bacterium]|nr:prolipoprotein diacylglyceryl transferase [Phycisphaerae bacterium]HPS52753.1 prolipoprotein diacylglyceryl transferase [Phycisphaerae bacterium]